ncbi:MAG: hypothetical protein HXM16_06900 [Fusobacterium periodonticum]|nr:hypothetical protein [Fusobacterium periodonticum]
MKKNFFILSLILFIFYSFNLFALNFPKKADKFEDFIPKGWKSIVVKKGDLNKDKIDDVVLVIEKDDAKNFEKSEDNTIFNYNPIAILVLFKDKNSQYNLISKNENGFIVSKDKALVEELETLSSPDLDDDLSKSINIKNDTLRLLTRSEYVKGARVTEYIFRYQNNKFELIGLEYKYWHTSTEYAVDIAYSINFSTKKLIGTKDISGVRTDETKIEKVEKNIDVKDKYILDTMAQDTGIKILEKYDN